VAPSATRTKCLPICKGWNSGVNILGLADGTDAGAALIVDDHVVATVEQERLDRRPHSRGVPWAAADEALKVAGLSRRDVDMVAIAGRFSPLFFLRRHPTWRRLAQDAFSPLLDVSVFYQALLRQTGFGALEADRTAEWFHHQLRERGFGMRRTLLVDVHRCLAEAAHRCQPREPVLVLTLHPNGDGVALATYRGSVGQLDKLWSQKGFASLHVHLKRCLAAMDLPRGDEALAWSLATRAEPDPALVAHLDGLLQADGPRLSRKRYPFPERREAYEPLARANVEVAAASLLENLSRVVCALVRHHIGQSGLRRVALGGGVFENPWLVARVAELPEVDEVWTPPLQGWASLALGAAASVGGMAPGLLQGPGLGASADPERCRKLVSGRPHESLSLEAVADVIAAGGAVGRCEGRGGFGRHGGGTRSVLLAPTRDGIARALEGLERHPGELPVLARRPTLRMSKVTGPLRHGAVAAEGPLGKLATQEVHEGDDPQLAALLTRLEERGMAPELAVLPLGMGSEPAVATPEDALSVFNRSKLEALWLGPSLVRR